MKFINAVFRFVFRAKVLIPLFIVGVIAVLVVNIQKKAAETKADRYRTVTVDRGAIVQRITANGTLNPVTVVSVGTQVSGTVTKIYTDFNKTVKANQILLELDPALTMANINNLEASLRSAEATQRLSESTLKRNQELVRKGFISESTLEQNQKELDVAKAQVAQAKSQLEREKINLTYTIIRSPIDGIVMDRKVDVGQTVAASFSTPTLFQIAQNLEAMQIDTSVAEADVGSAKEGVPVRFTVDAYPDQDFQGKIRSVRLNPTITQSVVTYNVIVDVNNVGSVLKPGMTAQVNFVASQAQDVVRIPNAALRFKPPKDDKDDKKPGKDGAKDNAKDGAKTGTTASANADASSAETNRARRLNARVYKLGDKNELIPVDIRTGISSNQHTELVSGDIKSGDVLVIRDLLDKNAKK